MNKFLFRTAFFAVAVLILTSCDNDPNSIGANIVGQDDFLGDAYTSDVVSYNYTPGAVASHDLPVNPLGIYDNPVFGATKYNFATQVQLSVENPTIDSTLITGIKNVRLHIPYFSTRTGTNSDGSGEYTLDSIFSDTLGKIKLQVYRSGYYFREDDPTVYNDQLADFESLKSSTLLNDNTAPLQNEAFQFSSGDYQDTIIDEETQIESKVFTAPELRLSLNKDYFNHKILSAGANLVSNNVFKNYFRGLYFKVDYSAGADPRLAMLNFSRGTIVITYTQKTSATNEEIITKTLTLNLTGHTASLPEPVSPTSFPSDLVNPAEKLYLKGGQPSMAVIDLFPNPGQLPALRSRKLLVNDARLDFYIDRETMGSDAIEPERIYLYDLNNRRPIYDFYTDQTSNSTYPKRNKAIHDGIIQKASDGRGTQYTVRITNHIRNLLNHADSTNVRLGLVLTENINGILNTSAKAINRKLRNQSVPDIKEIPASAIYQPFGTVLYGSEYPDESKRLKLTIYYTKPN